MWMRTAHDGSSRSVATGLAAAVTRRWRRPVGALLVLATAAGLAGCTPAPLPVAALRNIDGAAVLVLADCPTFTATSVSVYPVGSTTSGKWRISQDTRELVGEVPLFQVPSGWELDQQTLDAFQPGQEYSVAVYGRAERARPIKFTLAQLAALGPDQVLVDRGEAVSLTRFRDQARRKC
ncbi:hypothetical protein [Salinispora fenicalii]|uniref:hypothetical protein n=1 Tax=Salinispora fenicalii TaxID=1137263 RepID=UPI0004B10DFA|nr:hypothetical protein [Salinispora fenicalii]